MVDQPVPKVTAADVERIVRRDFSAERVAEVLAILGRFAAPEPHRVRLDALKLAAGDVARLERTVQLASTDYRDVIAQAEYPSYMVFVPGPSQSAEAQIIDADWKQYQKWLRA